MGRALVALLSRAGASLLLSARQPGPLHALAGETGARAVVADLAVPGDVERLAGECGNADIVVANAALPASGDLLDYEADQLERALAVNLIAPIRLAHLVAPRLIAAGRGHLVFVGSLSGKAATPESSLYTATKFGLRGFALALRQDLVPTGVGVSVVQPGFVRGAGMFAATGAPVPGGVGTVSPDQVAAAVLGAIEHDRAEINIAPARQRLRCAFAGQFPQLAERWMSRGSPADEAAARRIVAAQRALR